MSTHSIIGTTRAMDVIIAGLAVFGVSSVISGFFMIFRRKYWKYGLLLILFGTGLSAFIGYGCLYSPTQLEVREKTIDLANYHGEPLTVVILSDLHVGKYDNTARLERAVDAIKEIDAQYVFILGDLVNSSNEHFDELSVLEEITHERWVYAVYGNHDYHPLPEESESCDIVEDLPERLSELGITVLDNTAIWTGSTPENTIIFGGIRDMWAGDYNTGFSSYINEEDTFVLLSHSPDGVLLASEGIPEENVVDLVLSGHTHGGEVRFPVIGPLAPIPTALPRTYDQGLHTYDHIPVYITSGIGSIGTKMRAFNPPEIAVITIR